VFQARRSGILNYSIEGPEDAPVVTLSNSLSTDLSMWDEQAPLLAHQYRLLRYDTRGHGNSEVTTAPYSMEQLADDIAGLLDSLGIKKTQFVGLSLGGMTAQMLALRRPQLISSLCLVATTCLPPYHGRQIWDERVASIRESGRFDHMLAPMMDRWLSMKFRRESKLRFDEVKEMVLRTPPEGYIGCSLAIAGFDVRDRLNEIEIPTMVIAGEEDPGTTVEDAQMIHAGIKGAKLAVVPGARHLLNVDRPAAFTPLLSDWLALNR
jgi:3-oxoadipate enol-lactonase